jgi:hypothetical protein
MALIRLALIAFLCGCSGEAARQEAAADSLFRVELLSRVAIDQAGRDTLVQAMQRGPLPESLVRRLQGIDSANTAWLASHIHAKGFPTRARIGRDGVNAALLLIQHADASPAFQAEMLPFVEKAHQAGEVEGQEFAMLTDRVLKAQGRPQRYGTQMTMRDGVVYIDPIEDSTGVDERRTALGLMPLARYKQVLDSVYGTRRP